jgi:hypothetical protein
VYNEDCSGRVVRLGLILRKKANARDQAPEQPALFLIKCEFSGQTALVR